MTILDFSIKKYKKNAFFPFFFLDMLRIIMYNILLCYAHVTILRRRRKKQLQREAFSRVYL